MSVTKLNIVIICLLTAITCSAANYQIKVLNTPTITIDKKEAKVGDWFDDQSVIEWSRDNQAMRVVSDANKVYTLSAKLYKEANAKKFADFIAYTKPLASRGVHDATLIEQLQDRFDGHFVMLDEIVIDLSDLDLPEGYSFQLKENGDTATKHSDYLVIPEIHGVKLERHSLGLNDQSTKDVRIFTVKLLSQPHQSELINDSLIIEFIPLEIH